MGFFVSRNLLLGKLPNKWRFWEIPRFVGVEIVKNPDIVKFCLLIKIFTTVKLLIVTAASIILNHFLDEKKKIRFAHISDIFKNYKTIWYSMFQGDSKVPKNARKDQK